MASTELKPIYTLKPVWDEEKPKKRLELARKRANDLRNELLESKPVVYFRSFDLVRVPYPTWYAFSGHSTSWSPFIHILNRMFVVQFYQKGKLKTMLVSPSDLQGNRATPFFKRLGDGIPFSSVLEPLIAPQYGTVESHLQSIGLRPEDIDYITYDHLHTQDLRKWLGDTVRNRPAFFPNAKLLVPKQEWESTLNLLPIQADWYCPGGISGIPEEKIITYDTDVIVGDGVALILTPGHTEGNQSIVVHSDEGLMVTSENGVGAECYVPHKSNIPGLAQYAQQTNMEVILNGNTLEHGLNQYVSMVIEKEIAGPSVRNPTFPNVVNSSELSWYWLFPVNPSFSFGQLKFGKPVINEKYDVPY